VQRRPADPPFILSVGTIEARKDLETAVRALASLPGVALICVGPRTPYAAHVAEIANSLGVSDRLEFRGYVDQAALHELYSRARVLVFPSRYEGFGLPPLQALAAALPVVAADIPVLREVLADCALWAQPGNPESFARALSRVLAGDADVRAMVARGQMRAREFSWASVAERMVRLYQTLA
jgi:glycosyltransferase involved in cell wall biosynthesis